MTQPGETVTEGPALLWAAFYGDFSEVAIFDRELEALRYAVEHTMQVKGVDLGKGLREQLQ